jgi:DNA-binding NarL/FixJ family response regulator
MLAEALERGLTTRGFRCRVADLSSADSVLHEACRISPDLVLLDLDLGSMDGIQLISPLRAAGRRVLVVTGCEDRQRLAAAVAMGSVGWVSKARPFEDVLDAAQSACRDRPLLGPERRDRLTKTGRQYMLSDAEVRARISTLTPRELEVLDAIISGDTAQEMAERLVVSVGTVRSHIGSVLAKLGVSSQLAAAAVAVRWAASRRGLSPEDLLAPLRSSA